jgi:hypothetical protein
MLSLILLARIGFQVGNEEDAIWIIASLDVFSRECLYVACDGVLERNVALQSVKRELGWLVGWNKRGEERTGRVSNLLFSYDIEYGSGKAIVKMPMLAAAESLVSAPS